MGMYTELFVTARIKNEPKAILTIKHMLGETNIELDDLNHPLFSTDRWVRMLRSSSYYFNPLSVSKFEYDSIGEYWCFVSYSSFKNYDDEINKLFDWLKPYIDDEAGTLIGYHRYEEETQPTLVFL